MHLSSRVRRRLVIDLSLLAVIGVLLIAAVIAAGAVIYRHFYSPSAFVLGYVTLLSEGKSADALAVPGVAVDSVQLADAGLPAYADEALLRRAALGALTDIELVGEEAVDDVHRVTVAYRAGGVDGVTTFDVRQAGMIGVAPAWRFATSPLGIIELTVRGAMEFDVNGFTIDKRQVSPDGLDADPLAPVPLLVFSPGLYSVSVDTAIAASPGVAVLSDSPMTQTPVDIQALPTPAFEEVVQERVSEFLTACTDQQVLQPTGCPFGYFLHDRLASLPTWSIAAQPAVRVEPAGADWLIPAADGMARLEVEVRSLFDGAVTSLIEDVPFTISGTIAILPDGTANITVSSPDL